ncbi:MAG: hypothetical protein KGL46_12210 [Hyphomicrobiales bacterium]|nr:hypothetical protein [Hyphomicrobiales bacterium]
MKRLLLILPLALAATSSSLAASSPAAQERAQVRLIAESGLRAGAYHAAVVVDLAPDTITYWRNPGDAGVPPTFDFSASDNLQGARVTMPAPSRIAEADGEALGYRDRLVMPLAVTPKDAGKPVRLEMKFDYAACARICVPMHADEVLILQPNGAASADAALIAQTEAIVPKPATLAEAGALERIKADKPSFLFTPKNGGALDLFADAPDGYFITTRKQGAGFLITIADAPNDAPAPPAPVALTLTREQGALEFPAPLDAPAPAR